jgi:hypothetical protein
MTGVSMLLENPEILNQLTSDRAKQPGHRHTMMKESLFLVLITWVLALAGTLFWDHGGPFETVAKVASLIFFVLGLVGLLRFLFAFIFVKDSVQTTLQTQVPSARHSTLTETSMRVLTEGQGVPVTDYSPRSNTREVVSRPSVTENTTRLLEDQQDFPPPRKT